MNTSSDEAAFLKAIADNPADETARLAYADWLQDRADPRAAVVRASARFLSSVRELAELRRTDQHEWANVVDPLFGRLRTVSMTWDHNDGEAVVFGSRVAPAELFHRGRILFELVSDRMGSEIVAEEPGVVVCLIVKEGDRAPLGAPLLAYLRLPIELPRPPSRPPTVPLKAFVDDLERRHEALRGSSVERILNEISQVSIAARMVFGSGRIAMYPAILRSRGIVGEPTNSQQASERLNILIEVLRVLFEEHGQPTGFAELPAAE